VSLPKALSLLVCVAAMTQVLAEPRSTARITKAGLTGRLQTEHFVVYYEPSDPMLARLMADAAEKQLKRISQDLGLRAQPLGKIKLLVFPTHYGFIKEGGLEARRFTVGTALGVTLEVAVDASGVFAPPEEVLAHELAHVVLSWLLGSRTRELPLWFNEGVAKTESERDFTQDDEIVAEAAADGSLLLLNSLSRDFPPKQTALAYAQAGSALRYMKRRFGRFSPREVIRSMVDARSFDEAMRDVIGIDAREFSDEWYAHVTRKYRPLRIARMVMATVSAVMAVLVVIAYLVRRRQMAEAARRWEEESKSRWDMWS